tara:strand:+ start:132334 stop:133704 length:1371 start_codon:yes stop_codon:yes gene_type:complete
MTTYRTENDSMGTVEVPEQALYGAQTQRAVDNFELHQRRLPLRFIYSLAQLKAAAATANQQCDALEPAIAQALEQAADEVVAGKHDAQFPVSVFQTGSGTSTNMNMNEVLAHIATRIAHTPVHPNDHANCSQSSNDMIPSCLQVTALQQLQLELRPALAALIASIRTKSMELQSVVKTGRTHLMDAMPLTFGQELEAWAQQLADCDERFTQLLPRLAALPLGGSAVGTGVNVPAGFAERAIAQLNTRMELTCTVSNNAFARMAGQDTALETSACLRSLAVVLTKISNDLRWMASGPLAGLGEIQLQALQPGSSIMPGKVNPVLPEAVLMAAAEVIGNDTTITVAAQSGNFQLNVMLPLIADKLCSGTELLCWSCAAMAKTVTGFTVNHAQIERSVASNPILVTALNRHVGYSAAAKIAKRCYAEQRPVLDVAVEETGLPREELAQLLDPEQLTRAR